MKQPVTYFGKQIRDLRLRNGLAQKEFGDRWRVSRSDVSKFETTKALPSKDLTQRLSEEFKVDASEWVSRSKNPPKLKVTSGLAAGSNNTLFQKQECLSTKDVYEHAG